jgi:hypothetical protein
MRRIFVRVPVVRTVHRWESKRPHLASRPVVPLAMMMTTGGIIRMAGADGLPGLFQHGQHAADGFGVPAWHAGVGPRPGGRAGPAVAVAVGVVLQVGGQVFVGFGDAPEPVDGPGIGVVAVGVVVLAGACGRPS